MGCAESISSPDAFSLSPRWIVRFHVSRNDGRNDGSPAMPWIVSAAERGGQCGHPERPVRHAQEGDQGYGSPNWSGAATTLDR